MESEAGLTFRPATQEDVPFLHSSWGSSYFKGTIAFQYLSPEEFHGKHRPIRDRLLQKSNILICSPDTDPWLIIGWIATERVPSATLVHYIYVKDAFKAQGIATRLVKRAIQAYPIVYTHITERAAKIISRNYEKYSGWKSIPHMV